MFYMTFKNAQDIAGEKHQRSSPIEFDDLVNLVSDYKKPYSPMWAFEQHSYEWGRMIIGGFILDVSLDIDIKIGFPKYIPNRGYFYHKLSDRKYRIIVPFEKIICFQPSLSGKKPSANENRRWMETVYLTYYIACARQFGLTTLHIDMAGGIIGRRFHYRDAQYYLEWVEGNFYTPTKLIK